MEWKTVERAIKTETDSRTEQKSQTSLPEQELNICGIHVPPFFGVGVGGSDFLIFPYFTLPLPPYSISGRSALSKYEVLHHGQRWCITPTFTLRIHECTSSLLLKSLVIIAKWRCSYCHMFSSPRALSTCTEILVLRQAQKIECWFLFLSMSILISTVSFMSLPRVAQQFPLLPLCYSPGLARSTCPLTRDG